MKKKLLPFVFIYSMGLNSQNDVNSTILFPNEISSLIEELFENFPNGTELSLASVDGDVTKFIGILKQNDSLHHINNYQSIFEIGSITKVFTSTLLSCFALENRLNLNDPIQKYLAIKLNGKPKITFEQLANHTSGLPRLPSDFILSASQNPENPYSSYSNEMFEDYLKTKLQLIKNKDYHQSILT
jgi:CubicO group peptidase (beta-lactamase class C family)